MKKIMSNSNCDEFMYVKEVILQDISHSYAMFLGQGFVGLCDCAVHVSSYHILLEATANHSLTLTP